MAKPRPALLRHARLAPALQPFKRMVRSLALPGDVGLPYDATPTPCGALED